MGAASVCGPRQYVQSVDGAEAEVVERDTGGDRHTRRELVGLGEDHLAAAVLLHRDRNQPRVVGERPLNVEELLRNGDQPELPGAFQSLLGQPAEVGLLVSGPRHLIVRARVGDWLDDDRPPARAQHTPAFRQRT